MNNLDLILIDNINDKAIISPARNESLSDSSISQSTLSEKCISVISTSCIPQNNDSIKQRITSIDLKNKNYPAEPSTENLSTAAASIPTISSPFEFQYSSAGLSIQAKLEEQDIKAHAILTKPESLTIVQKFAKELIETLEFECQANQTVILSSHSIYANDCPQQKFFESFLKRRNDLMNLPYPMFEHSFENFGDLNRFLETENHIGKLISVIWMMYIAVNTNSNLYDNLINEIYHNFIKPQQDYITINEKEKQAKISLPTSFPMRFGNTDAIKSDLFSKFRPYIRDIDYRTINSESTNSEVQKYIAEKKPYIAGASGMANVFCKCLNHTDYDPRLPEGKKLCEIVAAFIVGSGMHSYEEVYCSFNAYVEILNYPPSSSFL